MESFFHWRVGKRQLTFHPLEKGLCAAHAFSETVNSTITGISGIEPTSRSLASRASRCLPSSGVTAMNLSPSPAPDFACCTVAVALICPSRTRKSSLIVAPTARGSSVSRNKPFVLRSRTRETSSRPLQRQYTQTSSRVLAREVSLLAHAGCRNDFIKYLCCAKVIRLLRFPMSTFFDCRSQSGAPCKFFESVCPIPGLSLRFLLPIDDSP